MYCPECGKENDQAQRFCRSCGLSLQPVVRAVKGESSQPSAENTSLQPLSRAQALWQNPFIYGLFLIVLGLIFEVIGDKAVGSSKAAEIGTLIAVLGVGLIGLKGVMLVVMPPRYAPRSKSTPQLEEPSTPRLLSAEPPSVTENTTRQLDSSAESLKERSRDTQPTS